MAAQIPTADEVRAIVREEIRAALQGVTPLGEILTTETAARIAEVSPKTIRNWIESGALPAGHRGRRRSIRRADLDRYLAGTRPAGVTVDAAAESLSTRSA